jgi:hypothetical protein
LAPAAGRDRFSLGGGRVVATVAESKGQCLVSITDNGRAFPPNSSQESSAASSVATRPVDVVWALGWDVRLQAIERYHGAIEVTANPASSNASVRLPLADAHIGRSALIIGPNRGNTGRRARQIDPGNAVSIVRCASANRGGSLDTRNATRFVDLFPGTDGG